ncbi:MAG: hypothetical protein ACRC92_18750 [Peptostreptococcaceae bacterium]
MLELTNYEQIKGFFIGKKQAILEDKGELKVQYEISFKGKPRGKMGLSRILLNALLLDATPYKERFMIYLGKGDVSSRKKFLQHVVDTLFDVYRLDKTTVEETMAKVLQAMNQYQRLFNNFLTTTISTYDFLELADTSERMFKILTEDNFNTEWNVYEIMENKDKLMKEVEENIYEHRVEPFYTLLKAGSGMRMAQFTDIVVGRGILPHEDEVIPHLIQASWLRGIRDSETFLVENFISRNANILTKSKIHDPALYGRVLSLVGNLNYLRKDEAICDTTHALKFFVDDQDVLNKIHGRYLFTHKGVIPTKVTKHDKHLIGTWVWLRDPMFCNSPDGVCKYCVGEEFHADMAEGVMGGNRNMGNMMVTTATADPGQAYLGAKHNQTPIPIPLEKVGIVIYCIDRVRFEEQEKIAYLTIDTATTEPKDSRTTKFSSLEITYKDGTKKMITFVNDRFIIDNNAYDISGMVKDINAIRVIVRNNSPAAKYTNLKEKSSSQTSDIVGRYRELMELLPTQHSIAISMLMRGQIFNKDKTRCDFSRTDISPTYFSYNDAIKLMPTMAPKFPHVGFKKDVLMNPNHYDPKQLRPSSYDVLFKTRLVEGEDVGDDI